MQDRKGKETEREEEGQRGRGKWGRRREREEKVKETRSSVHCMFPGSGLSTIFLSFCVTDSLLFQIKENGFW